MASPEFSLNNRIPSLDGLRAVSILLVVASHFVHTIGYSFDSDIGNLGVRVFFVISGFLITALLLKEIDKTDTVNLKKFYFRRTLRIFPPYYFYLLIMLALYVTGWLQIPLSSFFSSFTYTTNYIYPNTFILGHSWSLSVEEQFYLLYPGVLMLLGRRKTVRLLGLIILICPIIRVFDYRLFHQLDPIWIMRGFHSNADALAVGCLLTFLHKYLHGSDFYLKVLNSKLTPVLALPVIFIANAQQNHPLVYLGASLAICNILIALCLDWMVTNPENNIVGKILNSKPMVKLGVMSYSIYLWQQPFTNGESSMWFAKFPYNLLGIAVFSSFSYYFVEKFSLRLRQKLERKIFTPTPKIETASSAQPTPVAI